MYRKIIPEAKLRQKILKLFDFIPDKIMINLQYLLSHARPLSLKKPIRFTEKLQAYKLFYRKELMTTCADKYEVRKYVESQGLEEILIPLLGAYDNAYDINFDELPEQFVLKLNNGSHANIICQDKSQLNKELTVKQLNQWLTTWKGKMGREWAYYNIKPKIIAEHFLQPDSSGDLIDYKFFCFSGEPFCLYVIGNRFGKDGLIAGIFDCDFKQMPFFRADINPIVGKISKPKNFEHMLNVARKLSKPFPHSRIDLYNVDGAIYFGEITFYDGSGYRQFYPDRFDFILGDKFNETYEDIESSHST